ncbi:MAG: Rne/Rng family ribonuclease [Alphaproteobacteria bacterium]|nr:Rne/Rng family ribonuclease [Alphaproteobacteria bacterium]
MANDVLINVGPGETRVAVISDGRLEELYIERTAGLPEGEGRAGHSVLSNIVLGRVQRVLPAMQAAFVDIGLDRAGFLGAKEARCLADLPGFGEGLPPITNCVREGEAILVQIIKDPIGDKGARLSANVTIPGRLLILVPNQKGVAMSRRIEDEAERERLAAIVGAFDGQPGCMAGAGYIVRTVAIGAGEAELREDAERLALGWAEIEEKARGARVPSTVYCDLDPIARALRDCVGADVDRVLLDDAAALDEARAYAAEAMPEVLAKLELFDGPDMFERAGIEEEIEALLGPRVPLSCGGWITIETTEALTAIDVNSGSFTASSGLEETSFRINQDAAAEIGRQLRLRAIGGLVVIDFIHQGDPENVARVLQTLAMSLGRDRVPTQISPMSEFGLVEMTRKRVRDPIVKFLTEPARGVLAGGRVKTAATIANEFLRRIEAEARLNPGRTVNCAAHPEIARWISEQAVVLQRLRERIGSRFRIEAREGWPRDRFDVAVEAPRAVSAIPAK